MHIEKVAISNYRSIKYAQIAPSRKVTTLIGANNEGKSNVLRAIKLGLSVLEDVQNFRMRRIARSSIRLRNRDDVSSYVWESDFPISLQDGKLEHTTIRFDFEMSSLEGEEFRNEFGININGKIPFKLIFGRRKFEIDIPKQGKGKQAFEDNSIEIARFISRKLKFVYIPASRTAEVASQIINNIISERVDQAEAPVLARVEAELRKVRMSAFEEIETDLLNAIGAFVPDIREVRVLDLRRSQLASRSDFVVEIDDGNMTSLHGKGDGVQSLASIALMRSAASTGTAEPIFAIEEPEAHLHSDGIYKVREIIDNRPENTQLFLTTHSAIFAQRSEISSNIIVENSQARPARSIEEIRNVLGVRPPENLISCSIALLCEGESDCDFIRSFLCEQGGDVKSAIDDGSISIVDIDGCGNLTFFAKHYIGLACEVVAFVDNDQDGGQNLDQIIEKGLIKDSKARMTSHSKRSNSELEDLYNQEELERYLSNEGYKVDNIFQNHKAQFSVRLKDFCKRKGIPLSKNELHRLKVGLADRPWLEKKPDDKDSIASLNSLGRILSKAIAKQRL